MESLVQILECIAAVVSWGGLGRIQLLNVVIVTVNGDEKIWTARRRYVQQ
jgi:hypothetical protein